MPMTMPPATRVLAVGELVGGHVVAAHVVQDLEDRLDAGGGILDGALGAGDERPAVAAGLEDAVDAVARGPFRPGRSGSAAIRCPPRGSGRPRSPANFSSVWMSYARMPSRTVAPLAPGRSTRMICRFAGISGKR